MCARFSNSFVLAHIAARYQTVPTAEQFSGSYNIAPTELAPFIAEFDGERQVHLGQFGIPMQFGDKRPFPLVNIQSEKAPNRKDFAERRCIIPATGYYEWVAQGPKDKQPYYFTPKADDGFSFAGIWKRLQNGYAFSILTTQANEISEPIHNRMPVILGHNAENIWLDPSSSKSTLTELLEPCRAGMMQVTPVSKIVNSVRIKGSGVY